MHNFDEFAIRYHFATFALKLNYVNIDAKSLKVKYNSATEVPTNGLLLVISSNVYFITHI